MAPVLLMTGLPMQWEIADLATAFPEGMKGARVFLADDKKSKSAIVTLDVAESAEEIIGRLNGRVVPGTDHSVKYSLSPSPTEHKFFLSNLPPETTILSIRKLLNDYHTVVDVILDRGIAKVILLDAIQQRRAMVELSGRQLGEYRLEVSADLPVRRLPAGLAGFEKSVVALPSLLSIELEPPHPRPSPIVDYKRDDLKESNDRVFTKGNDVFEAMEGSRWSPIVINQYTVFS